MARWVRTCIIVVLAVALIALLRAPAVKVSEETTRFEALPDFDFLATARLSSTEGDKERALALVDYVIENDRPNAAMARERRIEWIEAMASGESGPQRLAFVGRAATEQGAASWAGLAGATVADFFESSDPARLERELGVAGGSDDVSTALRSAALVTETFPAAVSTAVLLKAARRDGALSETLAAEITTAARGARAGSRASLRPLRNAMIPVRELARHCVTWSQFKTALQSCASLRQVKAVATFAAVQYGNTRKLEQIVTVLGGAPDASRVVVEYVHKRGEAGLDNLYNAARKGPAGVKSVIDQPQFVVFTAAELGRLESNFYTNLLLKRGNGVVFVRHMVLALMLICLLLLARPRQFVGGFGVELPSSDGALFAVVVFVSIIATFLLYLVFPTFALAETGGSVSASGGSGGVATAARRGDSAWSVVCFVVALLAQLWALAVAKHKLKEVRDDASLRIPVRLAHLENLDTYFELPLYLGLAGSVAGFMLLTINPMGGRILAYSSTVVGIFVSLFLKVRLLLPYRRQLIEEQALEDPEQ